MFLVLIPKFGLTNGGSISAIYASAVVPSRFIPAQQTLFTVVSFYDVLQYNPSVILINTSGDIILYQSVSYAGFPASATTCGIDKAFTLSYNL